MNLIILLSTNANPGNFSPYSSGNILGVGQQLIEVRDVNCVLHMLNTVTLIEPDPITFDTLI